MSATAEHEAATAHHGEGHHDHGHDHGPFFAHHFESWKQQFDAGKLGMWAFLIQELLFFSGLFCAYATYRSLHPEVFEYADRFLSVPHGAVNTIVLLFSSLTMAWGVRCAMLGRRTGLIVCLAITLACAALFLGVKAYEYSEKYHAGLIWAGADPLEGQRGSLTAGHPTLLKLEKENILKGEALEKAFTATVHRIELIVGVVALLTLAGAAGVWFGLPQRIGLAVVLGCVALSAVSIIIGAEVSLGIHRWEHGAHAASHDTEHTAGHEEAAAEEVASGGARGDEAPTAETSDVAAAPLSSQEEGAIKGEVVEPTAHEGGRPDRLGIFFSIYFAMTGVHALHILGGMVVITWLMVRAFKNHFTPNYFGPVDFVGLYWHLVDLVWIYLFPLLYLIG